MENVNKLAIRNEFKLVIFTRFVLPSIRFVLTVYDLTATSLANLDILADKFVKGWSGVPKCASNTILHSKRTFNIPAASEIYKEAHNTSHLNSSLTGDWLVNHALDSKIARETSWSNKYSTTVNAEN